MLTYLIRPEYILQPIQVYRRLRRSPHSAQPTLQTITLPWGHDFKIVPHPDDKVEWSLWVMGIYDLALSETLWRLTDAGETVVDIGANIGYITSLLAARVGASGRVIGFEPNPEVFAELEGNCAALPGVELRSLALADQAGEATLRIPKRNRGEAALMLGADPRPEETLKTQTVTLATLDQQFDSSTSIGVVKIDIEGHELAALEGGRSLLSHHNIRDILYEQHEGYPSPASTFLESHGYHVFRLWKGFWRPLLLPADYPEIHPWEPPNYIATLEPERVQQRLRSRGWQVLKAET